MEGSHECDICFKRFLFSGQLLNHRRSHRGVVKPCKCDSCSKPSVNGEDLVWRKDGYCVRKSYTCKMCGKYCGDATRLSTHERTHTGERPFQCDSCPKAYASRSALVIHKRVHTEKPFVCHICGWSSTEPYQINRHKKSHEGTLKVFKCDECPVAFPAPSGLEIHKRIHTGEKPFQCIFCRKNFRRIPDLRGHKKRIHGCKCNPRSGPKCALCVKEEEESEIKEQVDKDQLVSEGLREFENESDIDSDFGECDDKQSVKNLQPEAVCAGEGQDDDSFAFEFVKCEGEDPVQIKEEMANNGD